MTHTDQQQRITAARAALILDQPFFGSLALRLPIIPSADVDTFATDGKAMFYNPQFAATLTNHELQGVIAHEVLHVANGHAWRKNGRNHEQWNQAADFAINPIIADAGMVLPAGGLNDPRFTGQSAEAIYSAIAQKPEPDPNGQPQAGNGNDDGNGQQSPQNAPGQPQTGQNDQQQPSPGNGCGCGEVLDAPADEATELEAEWQVATAQAAQAAKAQGKLPGSLARLVEKILTPQIDWKAALRRFVQQQAKADYSWKMPNRRYMPQGLYLPSLQSESFPPLVVAVDTSGSIGNDELSAFAAEVQAVLDECQPEALHVVYCDARINHVDRYEPGDTVKMQAHGGGGTDFRPVFAHVAAEIEDAAAVVYLTDGYGSYPDAETIPTLWVMTSDQTAPHGETVRLQA